MIDPGQAIIGIIVLLVAVGALLYVFYSRTNAVEKTGYGALIMLSLVSLMIPVFWIVESNNEAVAKAQQFTLNVQRGATDYAQYCYQCHGTKGQGHTGPKLNGNPAVDNLSDNDLLRIIEGGVYDPASPGGNPLMPAWSQRYGGPLDDNDIQYLFDLIRSSDPAYLQKNGDPLSNGFGQVPGIIQSNNPTAYQTAVAQESSGQFGTPIDMTSKKAITIYIINAPAGASCSPACYSPSTSTLQLNIKVKVGTTITWVNKSSQIHTVTALSGTNISNEKPASQIFDSGINKPIASGATFTYTVSTAAYNYTSSHTVIYYCQFHPAMVAELTIVQ